MTTWQKTVRSVRPVTLYMGDTIQRIALRETGDAANWPTLVGLNSLVPPYLTDDEDEATTGVLLCGRDSILVPSGQTQATGVTERGDSFGTDIAMVAGVPQITDTGDFAVVSGVANLAAAIGRRIAVTAGELVFHKDYGNKLKRLLGKTAGPVNNSLAAAYTSQAITSDPRVQDATVTATASGDGYSIVAQATAKDGSPVPVSANVE